MSNSEKVGGGEGRAASDVTLVLLAGGAGSRMGKKKDLVRVQGKGLVEWMLGRMAWRGPTMLVGPADRSHVEGQERMDTVVHDLKGGEGPLRGLEAAMAGCRTDEMVVMPIDMPGLGARQVEWVVGRGREMRGAMCMMLRRQVREGGDSAGVQVEPFPMFCRKGFAGIVARRLNAGQLSIRTFVEEEGVRVVNAPLEWEEWVWANLNMVEDVARFEEGDR